MSLRKRAEEAVRGGATPSQEAFQLLTPAQAAPTLHELQVHQVELEMQNDELRSAQAEIEAARERYFDLYDLAPVGYVTMDGKGLIVDANLTAATLLRVDRSAVVRRSFTRLIDPDSQELYYQQLRSIAEAERQESFDLRMLRGDGTRFWARLEMRLSTDTGTGSPAIRATMSDVSRDHAAAEEEARLRSQLAQAEKMESVGRLAGGIAHDFNNSLTVILGNLDMDLEAIDPADPLRDDLVTVRAAAQHSAELTAQLLAFARKEVVRPESLDLGEPVAITLRMLHRLIGEQIEIVWRPTPGLWPAIVDPTQVDRVLTNLCLNARDAIASSGRIEITTANVVLGVADVADDGRRRPGEWVRLSVRDSGPGIAADVMEHMFEPFFTTKEFGAGTGLGLATVEGIAAMNGGFVEVASHPGDGSTLSVYFPRSTPAADRAGQDGPAEPRAGTGETVLLVEDEAAVLRLVGEQLRRLGYVVLAAGTPEEAVRLAQTHAGSIDLTLSDVVLPGKSGPALVELIGQIRPGAGCLLMSGYSSLIASADPGHREDVPVLSKPHTRDQLAAAVRAALDARPPVGG